MYVRLHLLLLLMWMTEGLYFLPEKQFAQLIHLPFDVQLLSFGGKNGTIVCESFSRSCFKFD